MDEHKDTLSRGAVRWFILAFPFSILLTIWLYMTDRYILDGDAEKYKYEILQQLRSAQSGVSSISYDDRQGGFAESSAKLDIELANVAAAPVEVPSQVEANSTAAATTSDKIIAQAKNDQPAEAGVAGDGAAEAGAKENSATENSTATADSAEKSAGQ